MCSIGPFFFFNDTATTEIYTLSLHDALPIWHGLEEPPRRHSLPAPRLALGMRMEREARGDVAGERELRRSEEHTSELQSPCNLVCRLLLEKKKKDSDRTTVDNAGRRTPSHPH